MKELNYKQHRATCCLKFSEYFCLRRWAIILIFRRYCSNYRPIVLISQLCEFTDVNGQLPQWQEGCRTLSPTSTEVFCWLTGQGWSERGLMRLCCKVKMKIKSSVDKCKMLCLKENSPISPLKWWPLNWLLLLRSETQTEAVMEFHRNTSTGLSSNKNPQKS